MKLAQNKNIKLFVASLVLGLSMLSVLRPAPVHAGNPSLANPTLALCYNEAAGTITEVDLSNLANEKTCTDVEGQRVIKGGEATPVDLCVLDVQGAAPHVSKLNSEADRIPCQNNFGYVVATGGSLPKLNVSGVGQDQYVAPGCESEEGKASSGCQIDTKVECKGSLDANDCGITELLRVFINVLSGLVGVSVVVVLILGGIQYSTSAGDPNAAAAAKKRISNAILALVLFGMMYGFLQWIVPGGVL